MTSRQRSALRGWGIATLLCLLTPVAVASIGLAENSWRYQHNRDAIVVWHHGDFCGNELPSKSCYVYVPVAQAGKPSEPIHVVPVKLGIDPVSFFVDVTADNPNTLLWGLAGPVSVVVLFCLAIWKLYKAARARSEEGKVIAGPIPVRWIVILLAAFTRLGWALATLRPTMMLPDALSAAPFLYRAELLINIWILISPWVLWWIMTKPTANLPRTTLGRAARYAGILASGSFASFLIMDEPPPELAFYFPPLLAVHLATSLVLVFALKKIRSALLSRTSLHIWDRHRFGRNAPP